MRVTIFFLVLILFSLVGCNDQEKKKKAIPTEPNQQYYQAISLLGDTLYAAVPNQKLLDQWITKQQDYLVDSTNIDKLIWYGRFTGYTGDYTGAIALYTLGLNRYPNNSRLLRHRGHRYISIREFDKAITDFTAAVNQINGQANSLEEDGMPNAQNIPLTTKHGNIYYHLGLAYYLKGDYERSLVAYNQCLALSQNTDGLVSATHWIILNLKALGQEDKIASYLEPVNKNLVVVENQAYLDACLFYKGIKTLDQVYNPDNQANSSNSALKYGIARFSALNGDNTIAQTIYRDILSGTDWASFGFIAAEADAARLEQ